VAKDLSVEQEADIKEGGMPAGKKKRRVWYRGERSGTSGREMWRKKRDPNDN